MQIKEVRAKKIKDSRGAYTIEVSVNKQKASAPSGKSTGTFETPTYHKSIDWNVRFLNKTTFPLEIKKFDDLKKLESEIKQKAKLKNVKEFGANALVAFEIAVLRALAKDQGKELWQLINPKAKRFPKPVGNIVGGGLHSRNRNAPAFQEFLVIPQERTPKKNYTKLQQLHKKVKKKLKARNVNDEGAWQTDFSIEEILEILKELEHVRVGLDVAANSFYKQGSYHYPGQVLSKEGQIKYLDGLLVKYNLLYVEDPLHEDDFSGFSRIRRDYNHMVVGDDLTVTNLARLKRASGRNAINATIIKPNQNGSIYDLARVIKFCKQNGIKTIMSHRSGETMDDFIADLAFGFGTDYIKCGIATKWREAKMLRLIEIEKGLK